MKYYIIAGEASGDLHASNLMRELKLRDAEVDFRCWGGDLMKQQGAHLVKHYRDLAFMGFTEVLLNLGTIIRNLGFCKQDILQFGPDALILVDYPGFNLRIAAFAHKQGIPVFYYISPQIWAWKQSRIKQIRKNVDRMFTILPFEKDFYKNFGYEVDYVGHPLLDALNIPQKSDLKARKSVGSGQPLVALLPGSRKQEIKRMLPVMLEVAKKSPGQDFVILGAPSQTEDYYRQFTGGTADIPLVFGKTYEVLQTADAALVTSGTATLETALIGVPQAVCYKAGFFSYHIAKRLVKITYISLVNLIMDRLVVKEFIQQEMNVEQLSAELQELLNNKEKRGQILKDYEELRILLGGSGASARLAELMVNYLVKK